MWPRQDNAKCRYVDRKTVFMNEPPTFVHPVTLQRRDTIGSPTRLILHSHCFLDKLQPVRALADSGRLKSGSGIKKTNRWIRRRRRRNKRQQIWRRMVRESLNGLRGPEKRSRVCSYFGRTTLVFMTCPVYTTTTESRKRGRGEKLLIVFSNRVSKISSFVTHLLFYNVMSQL